MIVSLFGVRLTDWRALSLARRGHPVHVRTDPACARHRPAAPGTRLDLASRGIGCLRCLGTPTPRKIQHPNGGADHHRGGVPPSPGLLAGRGVARAAKEDRHAEET
jgi:hypothetical protein